MCRTLLESFVSTNSCSLPVIAISTQQYSYKPTNQPKEKTMKLLLWPHPPTIFMLIFLYSVFVCTWSICSSLFGVEFGLERSSRLQFGFGELRQVGHHRLFVHAWINDLLWSNHLYVHTVRVSLKGVVFNSKATFWPPARQISFVFCCLPLSWLFSPLPAWTIRSEGRFCGLQSILWHRQTEKKV